MGSEGGKKKLQLRLNERSMVRLEEMADRYGMPINSLISYIIGSWLDTNYDLKDKLRESLAKQSQEVAINLINNPEQLLMLQGLFSEMDLVDKNAQGK